MGNCLRLWHLDAEELNRHCRKAILSNHEWIQTWAVHKFACPCVHGDLCQVVDQDQLPNEMESFHERATKIATIPLLSHQWCFAHNAYCGATEPCDVEFSGLPCEENSRCNVNRKFMAGRFGTLYGIWAARHRRLQTRLIILENTEDTRQN